MFPRRKFHLTRWLRDWINLGAVPLATLNLQRGPVRPGQTIPDAWHHQVSLSFIININLGVFLCEVSDFLLLRTFETLII
jgi:hypothetical protein